MTTAAALEPDPDLRCTLCDYDLHGLPPDSRCPECGQPIEITRRTAPLRAWSQPFRRGLIALALALLLTSVAEATIRQSYDRIRMRSTPPETVVYLVHGIIFVPAAYWLTTPGPLLRRNPRKLRTPIVVLAILQILAAISLPFTYNAMGYWTSVALLGSYALAPLLFAAEVALLLHAVYIAATSQHPPLPRLIFGPVFGLLIYSVAGSPIFFAAINFVRIAYIGHGSPPHGHWLPPDVNAILGTLLVRPAYMLQTPATVLCLLTLIYIWYRLGRPNFATESAPIASP